MPDEPFLFPLLHEIPDAEIIEDQLAGGADVMQQIEIKITGAGTLQGGPEHLLGLLGIFGTGPGGKLGGDGEALPGMTLDHGLLEGRFGLTVDIPVGGVKIGEARLQEPVRHDLELFDIHLVPQHGQAHQAKAQLGYVFPAVFHQKKPPCR